MSADVEIADIRVFLALCTHLHFGRTAEHLGISQPRVTQVVKRLERHVGGRLADRTSRTVALTPLGERFRDAVSGPLETLQAALASVSTAANGIGPVFELGLVGQSSAGGPRLHEIIAKFTAAHPACQVRLVEVPLTDLLGPLRRGEVAAMCLRLPFQELDLRVGPVLSEEPRVLLVARDSPLASRVSVLWEELGDHAVADVPDLPDSLVDELLPRRTPMGRPVSRGPLIRNMTELLAAVANGDIVHPTSRSGPHYRSHPQVIAVPVQDGSVLRTALVVRAQGTPASADAFLQTAARVLASQPRA